MIDHCFVWMQNRRESPSSIDAARARTAAGKSATGETFPAEHGCGDASQETARPAAGFPPAADRAEYLRCQRLRRHLAQPDLESVQHPAKPVLEWIEQEFGECVLNVAPGLFGERGHLIGGFAEGLCVGLCCCFQIKRTGFYQF